MRYLVENKKIVMVGIPGVGKTTLLSKIVEVLKDHHKSVSVVSFGTLMFDVAKENGLEDRDGLRKLPVIENEKVVGMITATDIVNLLAVCVEDDIRDMYFHSVVKIYSEYSPYN